MGGEDFDGGLEERSEVLFSTDETVLVPSGRPRRVQRVLNTVLRELLHEY